MNCTKNTLFGFLALTILAGILACSGVPTAPVHDIPFNGTEAPAFLIGDDTCSIMEIRGHFFLALHNNPRTLPIIQEITSGKPEYPSVALGALIDNMKKHSGKNSGKIFLASPEDKNNKKLFLLTELPRNRPEKRALLRKIAKTIQGVEKTPKSTSESIKILFAKTSDKKTAGYNHFFESFIISGDTAIEKFIKKLPSEAPAKPEFYRGVIEAVRDIAQMQDEDLQASFDRIPDLAWSSSDPEMLLDALLSRRRRISSFFNEKFNTFLELGLGPRVDEYRVRPSDAFLEQFEIPATMADSFNWIDLSRFINRYSYLHGENETQALYTIRKIKNNLDDAYLWAILEPGVSRNLEAFIIHAKEKLDKTKTGERQPPPQRKSLIQSFKSSLGTSTYFLPINLSSDKARDSRRFGIYAPIAERLGEDNSRMLFLDSILTHSIYSFLLQDPSYTDYSPKFNDLYFRLYSHEKDAKAAASQLDTVKSGDVYLLELQLSPLDIIPLDNHDLLPRDQIPKPLMKILQKKITLTPALLPVFINSENIKRMKKL